MEDKIAIIGSGGGAMCSRIGGNLVALEEECGFKNPDIVVGGSGSVPTLIHYACRDLLALREAWEYPALIGSKDFISWKRAVKGGPFIDMDFLVDEILFKQMPLDRESYEKLEADVFIGVTNAKTGKLEHITNPEYNRLYQAFKATTALPSEQRIVEFNGVRYYDTHVSTSVKLNAIKAIEEGATKLIILRTGPNPSLIKFISETGEKHWLNQQPLEFRENFLAEKRREMHFAKKCRENNVKLMTFPFNHKDRVPTYTFNPDKILMRKSFHQGYSEMKERREEVVDFLAV